MFSLILKTVFTVLQIILCLIMAWNGSREPKNLATANGVIVYMFLLMVVMWL